MAVRSNTLHRNQSAGCLDDTPLRTVHQRPPKNIAPTKTPVSRDSARRTISFVMILLFLLHLLVFLPHPMPGIRAADDQARNQQSQRPGMFSRMAIVEPDTERRAEQRRNNHRPSDKPHKTQAKPDILPGATPRLELACCLRAYFPAEESPSLRAFDFRFLTHGETPPGAG